MISRTLTCLIIYIFAISNTAAETVDYMLIEAEDFTRIETRSDDFARVGKVIPSSGNAILLRIFNEGTIHYEIDLPQSGNWHGWVRYTKRVEKDVKTQVNGKTYTAHAIATTAKEDQRDTWGWLKLFETKIPAGPTELVIHPSPWKIDCILLTHDGDLVPDDQSILAYRERVLTTKERALMGKQVTPALPDFIASQPGYTLPAWFDGNRVQLHTRLGPGVYNKDKDLFFDVGKDLRKMGATVFSRHIVSGNEGAWWQSTVGAIHPMAAERNAAQVIIDDAHDNGLRLIAYYRHIEDEWAAETHPDWQCVDPQGNPIPGTRGVNMCMNSPYAAYVLQRQLELVDMGVDGFFYDSVHMPREGCWCGYCREAFTKMTDLVHPANIDPDDPVWHKLKEFNNYTIARVFAKWRGALHQRNPEIVMVVGSNLWPSLNDKHMDHRVFQIVDCHKTEFNKGTVYKSAKALWPFPHDFKPMELDVRLGFGFDTARDVADGRPAHVWAHLIKYESHMLGATAGMLAHGCIANIDVKEGNIPDANFNSSFAMGERVSPYLTGTRPIRQVAILHSESARDQDGLDSRKVWQHHLYPQYGAYHVLLRDRVPCGFIYDSQLLQKKFDGIDAIFVPSHDGLSQQLKDALTQFESAGGVVVKNQTSWQWHTGTGWPHAVREFRRSIQSIPSNQPISVTGGPEKMQMSAFASGDNKQLTICLTNDFSWVEVGGKGEEGYVEGDTKESLSDKPPPCSGVVVKLMDQPKRIFEANSGEELKWTASGIRIPDFEYLAVVVAEY